MAILVNAKTLTVERYTLELDPATGVDSETLEDTFTLRGSLQPVRPDEMRNLPDDFRATPGAKFKLYTAPTVDLRTGELRDGEADRYAPDRVTSPRGVLLYVHGLLSWSDGLIPHRKWALYAPQTEIGRAPA